MRPIKLLALLLAVLALGATGVVHVVAQDQPKVPAPADAPPLPGIWITEIDRDADSGEVRILLNVGREAGLERGDVLDIEREGKVVGKAKVYSSYADMAVAMVSEGQKDIARGDWVRAKEKAKRPPAAADEDPLKVVAGQNGYQVNAGLERGIREGQEATVTRDGKPVGKVRLHLVGDKTSTLKVIEGEIAAGDKVAVRPPAHDHPAGKHPNEPDLSNDELRRIEREVASTPKGVDFAAVGFLGVVAELEHPNNYLAPCHIGVLVKRVAPGSPAEKAQIRSGDRVIGIDDRLVRTPVEIHKG
ncbi:MAG: PDZ domain-containing protein, partial [Planctomycetota bacterium]